MRPADRRRLTIVLAASGIAHLGVFALLAIDRPSLERNQPPPIFEVEVVPFIMPSRLDHAAPAQTLASRPLRPRRALRPDETTSVAPLVTPNAARPAEDIGTGLAPSPALPGPPAALSNALRRGAVGCANPTLLSKVEREACLEKLGAGAKDAPFIPPPIAKDKLRGFEEKTAAQENMRIYRQTGIYPGLREALKDAR
ncbi:MAG: hypothetical protein V4820_22480 [Pseudomonadota bacterium]